MPSRERVRDLIRFVEQGKYVEALQEFYAEDATMQENLNPPRVGLTNLVAHERNALTRVKSIRTEPVDAFFVDGDRAVIHWVFEITHLDGGVNWLDELAYQRWRGDKVVEERFYYDPAQMKRG